MARRNLEDWFWQVSGDVLVVEAGALGAPQARRFWEPKTDLFEDNDHFVAKVELAGAEPNLLQIVYLPDRHSLLIRGQRPDVDPDGVVKRSIHQLEIYYGEFEREIQLPGRPVEPEGMRAQYRSGFLYVLIPKARTHERHVRVSIRKI